MLPLAPAASHGYTAGMWPKNQSNDTIYNRLSVSMLKRSKTSNFAFENKSQIVSDGKNHCKSPTCVHNALVSLIVFITKGSILGSEKGFAYFFVSQAVIWKRLNQAGSLGSWPWSYTFTTTSVSVCIIQHIRRPPLKCKSLNGGRKGGVEARSRAILWGAWMMRGRKNQLTDGSVTTGKERQC